MRQVWDGQIACLSTSSDEEDTESNLREPLTTGQLVEREDADRIASLRHHAASPRPATGPHGIAPSSGGQHERQLASPAPSHVLQLASHDAHVPTGVSYAVVGHLPKHWPPMRIGLIHGRALHDAHTPGVSGRQRSQS